MKIYALIGDSHQFIDSSANPISPTNDHVEMQYERPDVNYVAQSDGTWIEKIQVPQVVSKAQAVLALNAAGLWLDVDAYFTDVDTPDEHKLAWQFITKVHRDSAMLTAIAAVLKLTDSQINDLFIAANKIKI